MRMKTDEVFNKIVNYPQIKTGRFVGSLYLFEDKTISYRMQE